MSTSPSIRYRLETRRTKDFDKEQQIKDIKKKLEIEYQSYNSYSARNETLPDLNKLKKQLDALCFNNLSKQRKLSELQGCIKTLQAHRRSASIGELDTIEQCNYYEIKKKELSDILLYTEQEENEAPLLNFMKEKENEVLRNLSEKIRELNENMMELNKYTEKLTRNGVLAENIYERSSRSLSLSRQEMFKLSRIRRTRLKSLKTQESELSNEVKDMENSIIYKIYNKTSLKSKFTQISTRLNTLNLISNTLNPQKTLTPDKIEEINQKTSDLINIIKNSKFIPKVAENITLIDTIKYFNFLIFSESQLHLRFSELLKFQNNYKKKIQDMKLELQDIKEKFSDSQFIQNYKDKQVLKYNTGLDIEAGTSCKAKQVHKKEKIGVYTLKTLIVMQNQFDSILKDLNFYFKQDSKQFSGLSSHDFDKNPKFSYRKSINASNMIENQSNSLYSFTDSLKSILNTRFGSTDSKNITIFCDLINKDYLLKNFLKPSDINLYVSSFPVPEEIISNYYTLYSPAHENLRKRIYKAVMCMGSFISNLKHMSQETMAGFDNYTLNESQMDKILTLHPGVKFNSKNLKDMINSILVDQALEMPNSSHKPKPKTYRSQKNGFKLKLQTIDTITEVSFEDKSVELAKNNRKHSKTIKCKSQQEIKKHIQDLNSLLMKSYNKTNKFYMK